MSKIVLQANVAHLEKCTFVLYKWTKDVFF